MNFLLQLPNGALSLLVGLSDILIFLCVPAVAAALYIGFHRSAAVDEGRVWKAALRWGGGLGLALLVFCLLLCVIPGLGGGWDRLDYGILTGVPTFFVAAVSAYTILILAGLAAFGAARSIALF
ncbi:MAG TPA: hypothetical protein P5555_20225 [Candidatus Paceibacterota bacterium]|nr:hypothetical protein [Verrucomicrobiota bacterium]HRZ47509.1 hypothetical protein [Candidatus Paceibacterota bacterium]HRZ92839.1 hypothetical protein [Candidatus Paceibacterota bacterium]